jgi:hypothetical protein
VLAQLEKKEAKNAGETVKEAENDGETVNVRGDSEEEGGGEMLPRTWGQQPTS